MESHVHVVTDLLFPINSPPQRSLEFQGSFFADVKDLPERSCLAILDDCRSDLWELYQRAQGVRATVDAVVAKGAIKIVQSHVQHLREATTNSSEVVMVTKRLAQMLSTDVDNGNYDDDDVEDEMVEEKEDGNPSNGDEDGGHSNNNNIDGDSDNEDKSPNVDIMSF